MKNLKTMIILSLTFLGTILPMPTHAGSEFDLIRGNTGWLAKRDLTPSAYQQFLNDSSRKGYRPSDVEIWANGDTKRYAITMVKDGKSAVLKTSLDNDAFKAQWADMNRKGYRLVDQESYSFKGKQYYGGLWIKNSPFIPWRSHRNQTLASFKTAFDKNRSDGYMPIDVEAYKINGTRYYSSIWVQNKGYAWRLNKAVSAANISSFLTQIRREGKRVIDFNSYVENGQTMYAVIAAKDNRRANWEHRVVRSLKSNDFNNKVKSYFDLGYRLDSYDFIRKNGTFYYSGVFSLNNPERAKWIKRQAVYSDLNNWYNTANPAGMTAVVAHKGKIRFIRGFGDADKKNNRAAHGNTVYRIASISKAISGILGFRLEDKGLIRLDRHIRSRDYLSDLPTHHNYNLGELLTCRSLVPHYNTGDSINNGGQYNNQWDAVKKFMDWELNTNDTDGYVYSTPGYTIFAAALEKKTKKTFCQLVRSEISIPFGISSLACERRNRSTPEKSQLYSVNNRGETSAVSKPRNISWKYSGGGLEANAIDLARLGMKLIGTQIMSTNRRVEMTTHNPDAGVAYAYGWNYGRHDGFDWFAKSGAQQGARTYIRAYPDEDLVIVTLANTWTTPRFESLHEDIANEVLK